MRKEVREPAKLYQLRPRDLPERPVIFQVLEDSRVYLFETGLLVERDDLEVIFAA